MKQFLFCVALFVCVLGGVFVVKSAGASGEDAVSYDIIRVHIRANSNSGEDQNVKFQVKDAVVSFMEPKLAHITERRAAYALIQSELRAIESQANRVLLSRGFTYQSHARLAVEEFPTRTYDGTVFTGGEYTALIIELGTGTGNNWWCVMYPPLCFLNAEDLGTDEIQYKSYIKELLDKLKK